MYIFIYVYINVSHCFLLSCEFLGSELCAVFSGCGLVSSPWENPKDHDEQNDDTDAWNENDAIIAEEAPLRKLPSLPPAPSISYTDFILIQSEWNMQEDNYLLFA